MVHANCAIDQRRKRINDTIVIFKHKPFLKLLLTARLPESFYDFENEKARYTKSRMPDTASYFLFCFIYCSDVQLPYIVSVTPEAGELGLRAATITVTVCPISSASASVAHDLWYCHILTRR